MAKIRRLYQRIFWVTTVDGVIAVCADCYDKRSDDGIEDRILNQSKPNAPEIDLIACVRCERFLGVVS